MDMTKHERLGLRGKQRTGGELMVKTRHRHPMLRDAAKHRAVRHTEGRQATGARGQIAGSKATQQHRQVLAYSLRGRTRTHGGRNDRLVHRRHARKQRPQSLWHLSKAPAGRRHPNAVHRESHLSDPIRHKHPMAPTQQPEQRQGAGRFVGERTLQHQHRTMVGQAPDVAHQSLDRWRMQVQRVVGRVPGHDSGIDLQAEWRCPAHG
jgi:hypothetical protein